MDARLLWVHALSPIHIGAGDSVDVIDLPVVREKLTNWPYLPASGIKGVIRDSCREANIDAALMKEAFGPESVRGDGNTTENAGRLWFADARLLCFPVRSLYGTFAWVTCPLALMRLQRDLSAMGLAPLPTSATHPQSDTDAVLSGNAIADKKCVYLEDLDLQARREPSVVPLASAVANTIFEDGAWRREFEERFAIVSDNVFTFLVETCTEVTAHIKINDATKTVQDGALWYEEAIPAEAVFTMPLVSTPARSVETVKLLSVVEAGVAQPLQIGGKASVGRGLVRAILAGEGK